MLRTLVLILILSLGAACSSDPDPVPSLGPDHQRFFETKDRQLVYRDVPYVAETPVLFRTPQVMTSTDVRSLLFFQERMYAGTAAGLAAFDRQRGTFTPHGDPLAAGEVVDLAAFEDRLLLAMPGRVVVLKDGEPGEIFPVPPGEAFRAVVASQHGIFAGTRTQVVRLTQGAPESLFPRELEVRDLLVAGELLLVATSAGVWRFDLATSTTAPSLRAPDSLLDDDVRALALSEDGGAILAATAEGLSSIPLAGGVATLTRAGIGGLPTASLTAVASGPGAVLIGHEIGATALLGDRTRHYHSRRWIPEERVTAVAFGAGGTRWLATPGGVTRIGFEETTLTARAERYEQLLESRHWRMDGFVDDDIGLEDEWSPDTGIIHRDHDNDGLWTQMQLGPWCMAYAATGDERYYQKARKAMDVMLLQIDIPGETFTAAGRKKGFITRSLVRDDEGELFEDKTTRANWHLQEYGGRDYYWKDDTSSDEYAGHFFGYPLFYDLCAKTEEERAAIRERIRLVMDYVIEGDYQLLDLDGERTTHGDWKDQAIAVDDLDACFQVHDLESCASSWGGGGWLNSMEILGHLLATWHITGDQKYYDEYDRLWREERYGDMIPIKEHYLTLTEPAIVNHSDHELALLAYFTLLRYEPNAERRAIIEQSIRDFWELEKKERNPWAVSVMASALAEVDVELAALALRELPDDWRTWRVDNSHRTDARRWPADRHGNPQFNVVFPYDEIRTMKWNGNPYAVSGGGSGRSALAPTPYLIAYWKLRYYGALVPE